MMDLGEGFLGKALLAAFTLVVGGFSGWLMRRPLEQAGILQAVNARLEVSMNHLEREIARITKAYEKAMVAHGQCEEKQHELSERVRQVEGELRAAKQTIESMDRVRARQ